MNSIKLKTNLIQNTFRIILGAFMIYAGIGHLTFLRTEFQSQVPNWIASSTDLMDIIVIVSGAVEIVFGILMVTSKN